MLSQSAGHHENTLKVTSKAFYRESFEARQALAYSVGGLGPECCMDLVHIIFGSSHKVDVLDENFTPDSGFASLHHDVCEQLQAYVNWKNKTNLGYDG
jgi:hypothetical protein